MKVNIRLAVVLLISILFCLSITPSWAIKVGLLGADFDVYNLENYLIDTGRFTADDLTFVDVYATTPTLDEIKAFDAVLVWSNTLFQDKVTLGNNLANYVDWGGGVVISGFAFYSINDVGLAGRITTADYSPFTHGDINYNPVTLGTIVQPTHQLMSGVSSLSTSFSEVVGARANAAVLAYWNNGLPAVAVGNNHRVIGINMYSGALTLQGMGGDYPTLYANALESAASAAPEPSGMCAAGIGLAGLLGFMKRRRMF